MKLLLVRLDHAGDCAVTIPAVAAALKKADAACSIEVLTTHPAAGLLESDPHIDRLIRFDAPWSVPPSGKRRTPAAIYLARILGFALRLCAGRLGRYDAILYLSMSPWERFLCRPLSRQRAGFSSPYRRRAFLFSNRLLSIRHPFDETRHVLANCYDLVNRVVPLPETPLVSRLYPPASPTGPSHASGEERVRIGIHPGSLGSFKAWPAESFGRLAHALCEELNATCLVLTAPEHAVLGQEVVAAAVDPRVLGRITPTMKDYARMVAGLDLVVTNDGGPMHVAAGLGVPTVALFGPTDNRIFGPLGPLACVVRAQVPEAPCAWPWRVTRPCCPDRACLRNLSVDTVLESTIELMQGARSKAPS